MALSVVTDALSVGLVDVSAAVISVGASLLAVVGTYRGIFWVMTLVSPNYLHAQGWGQDDEGRWFKSDESDEDDVYAGGYTETDSEGRTYSYDASGNLESIVSADGSLRVHEEGPLGEDIVVEDREGRIVSVSANESSEPVYVSDDEYAAANPDTHHLPAGEESAGVWPEAAVRESSDLFHQFGEVEQYAADRWEAEYINDIRSAAERGELEDVEVEGQRWVPGDEDGAGYWDSKEFPAGDFSMRDLKEIGDGQWLGIKDADKQARARAEYERRSGMS